MLGAHYESYSDALDQLTLQTLEDRDHTTTSNFLRNVVTQKVILNGSRAI